MILTQQWNGEKQLQTQQLNGITNTTVVKNNDTNTTVKRWKTMILTQQLNGEKQWY